MIKLKYKIKVCYHHFQGHKTNLIQILSLRQEKANLNKEFQELQKTAKDLLVVEQVLDKKQK